MKKHLTFKDDKSDKFWNIEVNGKSFTVTYGKAGTAGQTSTKEFDTEEKCIKEAEKLVSEKVKKGYVERDEQTASASDFKSEWDELVKAKDLPKALVKHFSYLADSPGYDKTLEAVMKLATQAEVKKDHLEINIGGQKLVAAAPGAKSDYTRWPASFLRVIAKHQYIYFGNDREIYLGQNEYYFEDTFDEGDNVYELFKGEGANARSPLFDRVANKTNWIYHPKVKNKQGEEALFPSMHELADEINTDELSLGAIFLRLAAEVLKIEIPDIVPVTPDNKSIDLTQVDTGELILQGKFRGSFKATAIPGTPLVMLLVYEYEEARIVIVDLEAKKQISVVELGEDICDEHCLVLRGHLACVFDPDHESNPCYWLRIDKDYQVTIHSFPGAPSGIMATAINEQRIIYQTKSSLMELDTTTGEAKSHSQIPGCISYCDKDILFFKESNDCVIYDWNWKKTAIIKHKEIGKWKGRFNAAIIHPGLIVTLSGTTGGSLIQVTDLSQKKPVTEKLPMKIYAYSLLSQYGKNVWFTADTYDKKGENQKLIVMVSADPAATLKSWPIKEAEGARVTAIQEVNEYVYVLTAMGKIIKYKMR